MNKRALYEQIETIVIVTVISMLVWLYAESLNVKPHNNELITVRLVPSPGPELSVEPSGLQTVYLDFDAPSGLYGSFKELVKKGPIELEISEDDHGKDILLKKHLARSTLGELGIVPSKIDPETVEVQAERLVTITLPIEIDPGDLKLLPGSTCNPDEVKVTLPASLAALAVGKSVTAPLNELGPANFIAGETRKEKVRLKLPDELIGQKSRLVPSSTEVTFALGEQRRSYTISSIPIEGRGALHVFDEFKFELRDDQRSLANLKVEGPSDVIELIEKDPTKVSAYIRVKAEDIKPGTQKFTPIIEAPDGITFDPQKAVEVTISRRDGVGGE